MSYYRLDYPNLLLVFLANLKTALYVEKRPAILYRYPELSPAHKSYLSEGNSSLTLPQAPLQKQTNTTDKKQPVSLPQFSIDSLATSSVTPQDLSQKVESDDITFNSNDGISFADSLAGSDQEDNLRDDPAMQLPSPPAAAQPYDGDTDSESTHNDFSAMEGLNELGIYIEPPPKDDKEILVKTLENTTAQRPPSGAGSSRRNSTRSTSGIPRPIRSRSNSLASECSGSLSRRSSSDGGSPNMRQTQVCPDLDKSIDGFIQKKNYSYYTAGVVNAVLLSLEKKMEITNLNAEFMVNLVFLFSMQYFKLPNHEF